MDIDKKMMNNMFSRAGMDETRKAMNKFLEVSRHEPQNMIMMAMFRDMFMFKDMCFSKINQLETKIGYYDHLEERIQILEEELKE